MIIRNEEEMGQEELIELLDKCLNLTFKYRISSSQSDKNEKGHLAPGHQKYDLKGKQNWISWK